MRPEHHSGAGILALRLEGSLDREALNRALSDLGARHELLRSTRLDVLEVSPPGEEAVLDQALRRCAEELERTVESAEPLLFRVLLFKAGDHEHVLAAMLNPIAGDGCLLEILVQEVGELYEAHRKHESPPPNSLPRQRRPEEEGEVDQLKYWTERLDQLPMLDLPTDRPRSPSRSDREAVHRFEIEADLVAPLRALARAVDVDFAVVLIATYATLLSRFSGQRDFAIGISVDRRDRPELENVIGPSATSLPLRCNLEGQPSFRDLLRCLRDDVAEDCRHRQVSLEDVVAGLDPDSEGLLPSFCRAHFGLTAGAIESAFGDLTVERLEVGHRPVGDLALVAAERDDGGLDGRLGYDEALFDEGTIERFASHLRRLLEAVVTDPDLDVEGLEILPRSERERILTHFNRTAVPYPDLCLHELVERQVDRTPEAIAVRAEGQSLTYGELDRRANRIANRLRREGVGHEVPVGACVAHGPHLLPALLGILKAGSYYVPLDASAPAERTRRILEDAGVELILAEAGQGLQPMTEAKVVDLAAVALGKDAGDRPGVAVDPDNLVYVIYTSGSTGRPKGVMITHRALNNYLLWAIDGYGLEGERGAPMVGSISFDLSIPNLFLPLLGGKDVTFLREDRALESLAETLLDEEADFSLLKLTPSHLDLLRAVLPPGARLSSVRSYVIGADEVKADTVAAWRKIAPAARIIDEYGPTETVVGCSIYVVSLDDGLDRPVPIGKPIANTDMFVLDGRLNPVPVGVRGELYIGGAGVARGYRRQPSVTAESFIPHPYASVPGSRLYRTGDLARFRADGELEFLGRKDDQVKIRSYRVEPGEVEACLLRHPDVGEAAVVAVEKDGRTQLRACVVGSSDEPSLRAHLHARLPDYMVPSQFLFLDSMPLNSANKLDRGALVKLPTRRQEGGRGDRTADGERVARIYAEVLELPRVDPAADFFDLGGDSLMVLKLVGQIDLQMGERISIRDVFEARTATGLESRLEGATKSVPIDATGPGAPLVSGQRELWLAHNLDPTSPTHNSGTALRLSGVLELGVLRAAVTALVRRHEALRTRFIEQDVGDPRQLVDDPFDSYPVEVAEVADEKNAAALLEEAMWAPFDLAEGPLFRVHAISFSPEDHFLALVTHHIVTDGSSNEIICEELSKLMDSIGRGTSLQLPRIPASFSDHALRATGAEDRSPLDREFWRTHLKGIEPLDGLGDRPPPKARTATGGSLMLKIPGEVVLGIDRMRKGPGATRFNVLLAAFQAVLAQWVNRREFCVGFPASARDHPDLERTVGCFVSPLPVRACVNPGETFEQLVSAARRNTIEALAHRMPMEAILEEAEVARELGRNHLLQAMVQLDPAPAVTEVGSLEAALVDVPRRTSVTDLSLELREHPDGAIDGLVEYSADLFDRSTASRFGSHFVSFLTEAVRAPGTQLTDLDFLDVLSRDRLRRFNETSVAFPQATIHALITEQVWRTPDSLAIEDGDRSFSYREVEERANRLAGRLARSGVGPERLVGVCLPRSAEWVIALLAILKAGGVYLTLDPEYPQDRRALMVEDAKPHVLLTTSGLRELLPVGGFETILLDEDGELADDASAPLPAVRVDPDNLALVIYTSGSTGRPKAAALTHAAVMNLAFATIAELDLGPSKRLLQFAALSFDTHLEEVFPTLIAGGALILRDDEMIRTPGAFFATLDERRIDVSSVPTAFWHELVNAVEEETAAPPERLSLVIIGGERARSDAARQWCSRFGSRPGLLNTYGPTEATTNVLTVRLDRCSPDTMSRAETVSGRPLPNMRARVLDEDLRSLPPGVGGTIFLGGPQLARCYLDRPRLTAERFVPDPQGSNGERLYWTGDRGRHTPSMDIEILGRVDDQVKVRGFRVEPGEVEAVLLRHPSVGAAAVAMRQSAGTGRLIAYVVGADPEINPAAISAFVARSLPDYMVPGVVVRLDALPQTPSGKTDRKALPDPPEEDSGYGSPSPPRTETERKVAEIWAELLELKRFGVEERFIDLGGNSLLLMRLASRLERDFSVTVTLASLLANDTVRLLGDLIEDTVRAEIHAMSEADVSSALAEATSGD